MNRVGKILIAHPKLPENNLFYRTVIYLYQDNGMGSVGVILNRETQWTIQEVCEDKGISYSGSNRLLHYGGPVNRTSLVMLHSDEWFSGNTTSAGAGLNASSDNQMLERISIGDYPAYWRLFVGICAWTPGQLDAEMSGTFPYTAEYSWLLADANDNILFDYDGEKQWEKAIELSSSQMLDQYF